MADLVREVLESFFRVEAVICNLGPKDVPDVLAQSAGCV